MINKKLLPLLLGGLGIGTTEFVMMGMLPDIAKDLTIDIPTAGHLISSYALGVVVGAPLLVSLGRKFRPKQMLIMLMIAFTLFNLISAVASSYHLLLISRFFSGLPHGAFFGIGAVVASRIADEGKQASAIAVMFAGLTLANLALVPVGTWVGHEFSWRYTFGIVGFIGLVTIFSLKWLLPNVELGEQGDLKSEMGIFKSLQVWLIIIIVSIGTGGLFAWISYIAPLMTEISKFKPDHMSMIMVLVGFGMFVGNIVGAKLTDRFSASKVCLALLISMVLVLIGIYFLSENQIISLILTFLAGALSLSLASPIQLLMIQTAKSAEMLGASLIQAAFNIGNSLGAFFGGLPLVAGLGYNSPVLVGAAMACVGVVFTLVFIQRQRKGIVE
ncbi:MFS transporter [Sphingobacterium lactis]|uniref:MFS transporter, DHA1 family, arabinose polymer transporter n=1 Tax=Sphingobacterium lactis TaxID=797291 RepID=A0A1H5XGV4_9SPHI|nr:MFS transporter [Sphingobacterium lactis]SEG10988.1 MFS transporter, DHA1 family, arabinose polymer transporter [Sphingobacterium lactis]